MPSLARSLQLVALLSTCALLLAACAGAPPGSPQADRNIAGQSALEGMENAAMQDNNPNTPVRAKPPY